jgi:hypothetical protein
MIGDAALREVVGADLLGPIAAADLRPSYLGALFLLLLNAQAEETRAKYFHRLELVLQLRLLILLADDQAGGKVRDPHGGVGRVDALSTGPRRAKDVDADVLVLDLHVHRFRLRQHGDRRRGGMDAALALRPGDALHAMHPGLPTHRAVGAVSGDLKYYFSDSTQRAVGVRHRLDAPALPLAEAGVHAIEVRGEQRRFVAARAGPDLDDGVAVVERIARQERAQQRVLKLADLTFEPRDLGPHFGGELRVINGNELARLRELVLGFTELGRKLDDRKKPAVLTTKLRELGGVADARWVSERPLDLLGARQSGRYAIAECQTIASARRLGELLAEALDAAGRVHQALLAREERMACRAHVGVDLSLRRTSLKRIPARALDRRGGVLGMNVGFHWNLSGPLDRAKRWSTGTHSRPATSTRTRYRVLGS